MPTRTSSFRSHPWLTGIGGVLLVLVVVLGICEALGWPFLRAPAERMLQQRLQRDVHIGSAFRLHLLGHVRVRTDSLVIGPPSWSPPGREPKFFEAHDAYVKVPWSSLLGLRKGEPLRVAALEVGSFDATLWRQADGRANWQFPQKDEQPQTTPRAQPEFDRLVVRNGRLAYDDAVIGLKLNADAQTDEGQASDGNGSGSSGSGSGSGSSSGNTNSGNSGSNDAGLRVQGGGHYREGDFRFTVRSRGVLPLIAPEGSGETIPLTLHGQTPQGRFDFDGRAQDIVKLTALDGSFDISGTSLAAVAEPFGITLPTTAKFQMQGRVSKNGDVYKANVARFDVGASRLGGDFTFDRRAEVPVLTGTLRGRNLDLADLGPAFGGKGPKEAVPQGGSKRAGKVLPDREFDIPSLKQMNADVRVDLQRADLHTGLLDALTPLNGRVRLQGGVLSIDELDARTSGGELRGRLTLDGRVASRPRWDGDLRWANVRLEQWINARNRFAKEEGNDAKAAPAHNYITGLLGGQLQFTGAGRSIAAMAGSLDGSLGAWVTNGTISHLALEAAGIDVAQALGVFVKGDNALPMQCAVTHFNAKDGLLRSDVGIIDTQDTTLLIGGEIGLRDEGLNLVAAAKPKDFSPLALRTPIHLEGSFAEPHVRLEMKRLGVKAAAAAALAVVNPLAALIPLLDPASKSAPNCGQELARLRGDERQAAQAHGKQPLPAPAPQRAGVAQAGSANTRQ